MRKTDKICKESRVFYGVLTLVMAVVMVLFINGFALIAQAAGTGKVKVNSARVRKEASTSSDAVGSLTNGAKVTINSEVQAADGWVWYQITSGTISGYVRSDLVDKDEASEPPVVVNPTVEVTKVQPMGATVSTSSQTVRVRVDASTTSSIITQLTNGTAITVNGQAKGTDGNVWYLVAFTLDGASTEGFIRYDYVTLPGTLVPVDTTTTPENPTPTIPVDPVIPEEPTEEKLYDTYENEDGQWILRDGTKTPNEDWPIGELLKDYQDKSEKLDSVEKSVKSQKIVIIILVVLLIVAILAVAMLFFKIRDVMDDAYFAAVEKETLRERNAMKNKDNKTPVRKVMQTVGTDGTKMASEGRSAANRPQGRTISPQGTPVANGQARPAQPGQAKPAQPGQARPAQPGQARPAQPGQTKPAQPGQTKPAQPGQTRPAQPGQKPAAQPMKQATPAQSSNQAKQNVQKQTKPTQSKGFANDDDEFEFEFLNWDGEEKK